ncbi:MAG: hypothetical protein CMP54_01085 [Flavobacteriales bacterium]|nr:hypothetical protein [Flavobacteriales bacterium]|tara:strand:- start:511 stop:1233 length:723 start_codon:yes stop_codon:yes gene_type:complete
MNKNVILTWALFTILSVVLITLIYSNCNIYNVHNKFIVEYIGDYNQSMTSKDEIINISKDFFSRRDSVNKDINTQLLEDLITQDTYIKKAEVYLDISGVINIYVYFREPFIRLLRDNNVYYFDTDKVMLPSLSVVDDDLLVVTGNLDDDEFEKILLLVKMIYDNNFLNQLIGGVHYDESLGYTLSSKMCDLAINIGKNPVFDKIKIDMIELFHRFLSKELNCDYCKSINIEYDQQIICIK